MHCIGIFMKSKKSKKIKFIIILILFFFIIPVFLFEIIGQMFVFKHKLYFINDVAHRMDPSKYDDVNSDGIRSDVEADEFMPEDVNIIFLGDSFVYGYKLNSDQSVPHQLETKLRALYPNKKINIANFGWVSSSPLLSYDLLKDIGKKYHPDYVILGVDMTDIHDDIKYKCLIERKGIYNLLDVVPITFLAIQKALSKGRFDSLHETIFRFPARRFFASDKPLSETRHYFSDIQSNIDLINQFTTETLGAKFRLFVFPRTYQYSDKECPNNWEKAEYKLLGEYALEPFKYFSEIKALKEYPIDSLLLDFKSAQIKPTSFNDDPHWNEAGVKVVVDAIYRACVKDNWF